ncbi:type II toxin-antitoxin system HicB family antitoxin [Ignatzschineria larvae DSM 13226]|uniref:Type II toxin-antitoxin system HicB family antitoxin n=1 Tax=Ignatzschineria larvae DSM 13226 TaxID=1111732 RepID=A0ABZ3BYL0_9GAMM|nr:type II toxin-antitoxin system HicB family antitoxin [Ignatzschineria larvae]
MLFHLVIHKDSNSCYGVTIPSLPGTFSSGESLEKAVINAKDALIFQLEGLLEDGIQPNVIPFTLDEIFSNPDYQNAHYVTIDIDVSAYTLKPERFNVSWPKYLIKQVDEYTAKNHDNRSSFLAKAAKSYIENHSS